MVEGLLITRTASCGNTEEEVIGTLGGGGMGDLHRMGELDSGGTVQSP